MSWKVIGIIESRAGDLEVLPEWSIGTPNSFENLAHATTVKDSMQSIVDQQRAPRTAGQSDAPKLPPVKYMVLPCIDSATIDQLHGRQPAPQPQPPPTLSFGPPTQG